MKKASLRFGDVGFSLAKEYSKNPGFIYFFHKDQYSGKISTEGKFSPAYNMTEEAKNRLEEVCQDPAKHAVNHGLTYKNCACCGRELTNQESKDRGIGPICAEKWGF